MLNFRDIRDLLYLSHFDNNIEDEEFMILLELVKSKNRDLPYWTYPCFDLEKLSDDECLEEFRFMRNDIYELKEVFNIPDQFVCYNGTSVTGIEGLCIYLKRYSYPCRFSDMTPRFGRSVQELCVISNWVFIFDHHNWRLTSLNQPWLSPNFLEQYSQTIHNSGAPLQNCWGFVDGTLVNICRPREFQRLLFNGHKRVHAVKFQSVVTANGLIANLFGPIEGRKHDAAMLRESNLLVELRQFSHSANGNQLCIYGDPAYSLREHLQGPFRRGINLTPEEAGYNRAMSHARVAVEWVFADIKNYFAFLDFKKKLKIGLSAIGKMYSACALLHNARTCLYGNLTSSHFDIHPPQLRDYFQ